MGYGNCGSKEVCSTERSQLDIWIEENMAGGMGL
jgi:hypothetical protein